MFALALSGGGLLGAAHLGVLQVLEENGLWPSAVAGTSAGGLVASMVASGVGVEDMVAWGQAVTEHPEDYFELNTEGFVKEIWPGVHQPATGIINPQKFLESLIALSPTVQTIADWAMPCAVIATNIAQMQPAAFTPVLGVKPPGPGWEIIQQAHLRWALGATMAIPALFDAVRHKAALYVDGGISDTLPINWAFQLCPGPVIGVNVAPTKPVNGADLGIADILARSEAFVTQELSDVQNQQYLSVVISPPTEGTPFWAFHDYHRLIALGRHAAIEALPDIAKMLSL
ncbi:hypothetical protein BXT84_15675 [Sulfobacillus thermotolerans]|uniref:PNPLA domain-containing protein n=1 Tax=Sulfobacillus thermotolerans TaxID=338644 RepID=A0ABN5H3G1_9FIRM|nr:hypothetical protein BXT84_15675 [Sulfobacillus thermotolerans]